MSTAGTHESQRYVPFCRAKVKGLTENCPLWGFNAHVPLKALWPNIMTGKSTITPTHSFFMKSSFRLRFARELWRPPGTVGGSAFTRYASKHWTCEFWGRLGKSPRILHLK